MQPMHLLVWEKSEAPVRLQLLEYPR